MLQRPEPLSAAHVLDGFDSGVASLDDWLCKRALANQTSGASRTFVTCDVGRVVAYYALAASAIATASAPGKFHRNMPDPILYNQTTSTCRDMPFFRRPWRWSSLRPVQRFIARRQRQSLYSGH